jgi:hypothetical protein
MNAFTFAGFRFPRHIPQLVPLTYCGAGAYAPVVERIRAAGGKPPRFKVSASYYAAPAPLAARVPFGERPAFGFYLDSDFAPGLRWVWADKIEDIQIRHTGWFCDEFQDSSMRGIVLRLPHGRGFLAGYALGVGMSATVEREIYACERKAAYAADRMAERAAEVERDYQDANRKGAEAAEAERESSEARAEFLELAADLRRGRAALAGLAGPDRAAAERLCGRLRERAEGLAETWRDKRAERDSLRSEWGNSAGFVDGFGS